MQSQTLQTYPIVSFIFIAKTEELLSLRHRHTKKSCGFLFSHRWALSSACKEPREEPAYKYCLAFHTISILIIGHLLFLQSSHWLCIKEQGSDKYLKANVWNKRILKTSDIWHCGKILLVCALESGGSGFEFLNLWLWVLSLSQPPFTHLQNGIIIIPIS